MHFGYFKRAEAIVIIFKIDECVCIKITNSQWLQLSNYLNNLLNYIFRSLYFFFK